ncbi:MAG TPA: WecB/TagA/CpsF family glycosyltransferase [Patescibacteria group bacterium]|nr:WecB/TagA/CpsF family glycosyltransferase [Patescibacteria group bacterium]
MRIWGVPIDTMSQEVFYQKICHFLDEQKWHRIATVNPEFLLLAEKDVLFREALLRADLRIADGFGIVLAGLLHGERLHRFAGADLMEKILEIANKKKLSVYLAINRDGLSSYEEIKNTLGKQYHYLKIDGNDFDVMQDSMLSLIPYPTPASAELQRGESTIFLCNFGAPYQELFLAKLQDMSSSVRLAMGVGGSFDYLTGKIRRAPFIMRMMGLEWFWRLMWQPKRWRRIWRAVLVFPFRVIFATIQK